MSDGLLDLEESEDSRGAEPLAFLASLMQGKDPRKTSKVWTMVNYIEEENFGDPPSDEQWQELVEIVEKDCKPAEVDIITSTAAAKTLAEYHHPKRKSIEISAEGTAAKITDLNADELDLFEEWFNAQF